MLPCPRGGAVFGPVCALPPQVCFARCWRNSVFRLQTMHLFQRRGSSGVPFLSIRGVTLLVVDVAVCVDAVAVVWKF